MRKTIILLSILFLASCKTQKSITETKVAEKRAAVILKPEEVAIVKKDRAYELGKRVLEACNTSRFKAFTTIEATDKVIANATAEKISATCQKIILRNGKFIGLNLIEIVHNELTDEYFFRYDIKYEKPLFKRELRVTINSDNKVSAISTKEIKSKPF
ncbi:hypothetical protein [Flavobacterium sp.]|uniref:hypothetical protein n=1 Tax=Flavobacterium sp. TaxID=239 RepID=UPI0025EDF5DA|nr:hypothetical protein [Flavobacterium sp.]